MYKHPVVLPQKKIRKDTQIIHDTDTQRSIQKQQQSINISNNKYGRLLRQDNSYHNGSIKMMNKTIPYPPPYHMVGGGHHPYPTHHQYHHPYHMSHMSNHIYPQPASTANNATAANNKQTATLQYNNATTSKQQEE